MSHPLQRASPPLSWSWAGSSVCSCQLGFTRNPVQRLSWHLCIQAAFSGIWSLHFREFGAQLNSNPTSHLCLFHRHLLEGSLPAASCGMPHLLRMFVVIAIRYK